jgi:hypothetical protein
LESHDLRGLQCFILSDHSADRPATDAQFEAGNFEGDKRVLLGARQWQRFRLTTYQGVEKVRRVGSKP